MTTTGTSGRNMRLKLMTALMCGALLVYLALLGRTAVLMINSGRAVAVALGLALLVLPGIGLWAMVATLRAGLAHQTLARLAAEDGMELDVSALPRRPSGRIERNAADALFDTVRTELDSDPDNWRRWYRLARAYDYAGDRGRALKHAFDVIYYPCLDATKGRPFGLYLHGNEGTEGAERGVDSITTGLGWVKAAEYVVVSGKPGKAELEACWELGATVAAQLME
jgi:hypothetical protein